MKCFHNLAVSIFIFVNTLSRLKTIQILYRFKNKLFRRMPKKIIDHRFNFKKKYAFHRKKNFLDTKKNEATFIGLTCDYKNVNAQPLLWQYNFFYFDSVLSSEISEIDKLDFFKNYIYTQKDSSVAFDPYVISMRSVNLIKWVLNNQINNKEILFNLKREYSILINSIEYHLLANHLLANLKALIFFEIFFPNKFSKERLRKWKKNYLDQLKEQILDDGGHFELSPMYHNIILEDLLELKMILIEDKEFISTLDKYIAMMFRWSKYFSYSGTGLPVYFHDSCGGIARNYKELASNSYLSTEKRLKNDDMFSRVFSSSGFFFVQNDFFNIRINCSNVKCSYTPGHFHSSQLSYDIEAFNEPIIISSGLSTYENSLDRINERGNYFHPSITLNKGNHSEIWKSFRLGKSPQVHSRYQAQEGAFSVNASFKGKYRTLFGRKWLITKKKVIISDTILEKNNSRKADYFISIPLYPSIMPLMHEEGIILISKKTDNKFMLKFNLPEMGSIEFESSYHCKSFGIKDPTSRISINLGSFSKNEFNYSLEKI